MVHPHPRSKAKTFLGVRDFSAAGAGARGGPHRLHEAVEVGLGPGLLPAVTLLQGSHELVAVAFRAVQVVVGEIAPEPLGISLDLLPASLEDVVGCHRWSPFIRGRTGR